jgi:hypothetical protein
MVFLPKIVKIMKKTNFRDWTLDKIDIAFGTVQLQKNALLDEWLGYKYRLSAFERRYLKELQETWFLGGDDWLEIELENKFISPLIVFAKIDNREFAYFLERELAATIGEYELSGKVDDMVASGYRSPKKPYFCLNEYKSESNPDGDPRGQALIAMLVAQTLNNDQKPIFGSYIVGRHWHFMVLQGNEYTISKSYTIDDNEIFAVYQVLKGLRFQIEHL